MIFRRFLCQITTIISYSTNLSDATNLSNCVLRQSLLSQCDSRLGFHLLCDIDNMAPSLYTGDNYLRFYLKYIEKNLDDIENDMNKRNSSSKNRSGKSSAKTRKKRKELSVSATKSIKKEEVEARVLTDNYIDVSISPCAQEEKEEIRVEIFQVTPARTYGNIVD